MSWNEADKAREGKGFVKIVGDGDKHTLIIATEPMVVQKSGFRGQAVTRYYFGVIENGEVKVLDTSKATCGAIANATDKKCPAKVEITRCGSPGDPKTTYEIKKVKGTKGDAALVADNAIKAEIAQAMGTGRDSPPSPTDPNTGEVFDTPVDDDTIPF